MAIKFSQFTVRTSSSDLSHIVGYNGADNIQITPTNFLNSALTGTAGQVLFYDTTGVAGDNDLYWDNTNKRLGIGTTSPDRKFEVESTGTGEMCITGATGSRLYFRPTTSYSPGGNFGILVTGSGGPSYISTMTITGYNNGLNTVMTLKGDGNVGIGTASPSEKLEVVGNIKVGDSEQFIAGAGNDLKISHNGVNSVIESDTGNLALINTADNRDILFQSDDGSGGTTTYLYLDGSIVENRFSKATRHSDNIIAKFGDANDLNIYSNGSNSYIENFNNDFIISNTADDKDIRFFCDNGSGGTTEYFKLDGTNKRTKFSEDILIADTKILRVGSGADLQIVHDGTDSLINNYNGHLYISNLSDDKDIYFRSDDGSGGVATYFEVQGANTRTVFRKTLNLQDSVDLYLGTSSDLRLVHNGSDSVISNATGNLTITNNADDKDIIFQSDNGSGGVATYFFLDGSATQTTFQYNTRHNDSVTANFGNSSDLQILHNGTDSFIDNYTGDLTIRNRQDNGDIKFVSDDGSGGLATYFYLDGNYSFTNFQLNARWVDNAKAEFGNSGDLDVYHDGTTSYIINATGNLEITNTTDDGDILFRCDDGSGGNATYFQLDGSDGFSKAHKKIRFLDNAKATFGNVDDLQIYHDGSNSFIKDVGTGVLSLQGNIVVIENTNGANMLLGVAGAQAQLYYNGVSKLETRTTGVKIEGVSEYADNTAAIAGGLTAGDVYRTGDLLKIVH